MSNRVKRLEKQIKKHGEEFVCEKMNITIDHLKRNLLTGKSNINVILLKALENIA